MRSFLLFVALTLYSTHSTQGWTAPQQPPPSPQQLSSASRRAFLQNIPLIATTAAAVVATGSLVLPSIATAATAADGTAPKHPPLVTGARAPDFELPNSRGEGATSLDQLINSKKWTVLYFYPGAFTQGKELFLVLSHVCIDHVHFVSNNRSRRLDSFQ
jgi:AhpC/TSA family